MAMCRSLRRPFGHLRRWRNTFSGEEPEPADSMLVEGDIEELNRAGLVQRKLMD
jgi:hypothetical protein